MKNFPGIRFVGNEALTLLAQSIVPHNHGNVEIVRINPEDMQSPQAMALIGDGLSTFPLRVASVLKELSTMHDHKNGNEVFECGQQLLAIKDETLLAIFRREFDSKYNAGNVDEAVQLFEKYARRLTSNATSEQIFEGMRAGFSQLDIKGSSDTSKQQEAMIAKALQALPEDLVNACNNLGVSIVVKKGTYASSLFANRTISVSPECFERGQQGLERALKEEMIHYVDSFIRFTHRPEWHEAAKKALGDLSAPEDAKASILEGAAVEQLIERAQNGEIGAEELERAIAMLDQEIRTAQSHIIGKNSIDHYEPHVRHAELLPDIIHAIDVAQQEGAGSERNTDEELREIYGRRAVELVENYWHEVKQVAENRHPALHTCELEKMDYTGDVSVKRQSSQSTQL